MNKVILVGSFHEIIELCEFSNVKIIGIIDNNLQKSYRGYKILGNDTDAKELFNSYKDIPLIITPDDPAVRSKLVERYMNVGYKFYKLISPKAFISPSAQVGRGAIIQSGANVSANVIIEDFVKINTMANVMHDTKVGKYSTVAPNAVILGYAEIGERCYIGANSTILPNKIIYSDSIVGAGAVVTKDVISAATVKGNPAKSNL